MYPRLSFVSEPILSACFSCATECAAVQEQDSEPQSSGLGVELSSPRPQGLFQLPAKTERHQPRLQHGLQQQPASPGHEAAYDMGDDDDGAYMPEEQLEISLGAGYAEKRDTPHVPANIHKSGMLSYDGKHQWTRPINFLVAALFVLALEKNRDP